jgi:hypothetical protein
LIADEAKHGEQLTATDRQARHTLLRTTALRASAMSDVEFTAAKSGLAEQIAPPDRLRELQRRIDGLTDQRGLPGRASQFLLNPDFISQLRFRGAQLAQGPQQQPANLTKGPQAENTDAGFAIKPRTNGDSSSR